jgi:hypothetical protein
MRQMEYANVVPEQGLVETRVDNQPSLRDRDRYGELPGVRSIVERDVRCSWRSAVVVKAVSGSDDRIGADQGAAAGSDGTIGIDKLDSHGPRIFVGAEYGSVVDGLGRWRDPKEASEDQDDGHQSGSPSRTRTFRRWCTGRYVVLYADVGHGGSPSSRYGQ